MFDKIVVSDYFLSQYVSANSGMPNTKIVTLFVCGTVLVSEKCLQTELKITGTHSNWAKTFYFLIPDYQCLK